MREILFRGKRVDNGEWVYGSYMRRTHPCIEYFRFAEDGVPEPEIAKVIPETVGQYVGVNDRNDVRIFDGDIVKDFAWESAGNKPDIIRKIEYFGNSFGFFESGRRFCINIFGYGFHPVVIGNVYDNPELLENSQNLS